MNSAGYKQIAALSTALDIVSQRGLRTMIALRRGGRGFRERAPTHYYNVP